MPEIHLGPLETPRNGNRLKRAYWSAVLNTAIPGHARLRLGIDLGSLGLAWLFLNFFLETVKIQTWGQSIWPHNGLLWLGVPNQNRKIQKVEFIFTFDWYRVFWGHWFRIRCRISDLRVYFRFLAKFTLKTIMSNFDRFNELLRIFEHVYRARKDQKPLLTNLLYCGH